MILLEVYWHLLSYEIPSCLVLVDDPALADQQCIECLAIREKWICYYLIDNFQSSVCALLQSLFVTLESEHVVKEYLGGN